jgi:hypothetical protein
MNKFTQAKKDDIDNLITNLKEYWRNDAYDLCRWLVGQWIRLKKQNERLQVILVDHSNYQIPWETLVLTDRVYLGAEARVVRWKPIHTLSESRYLFYERDTAEIIQADVHHEAAIAYLDKEDVTKEPIGYPELATLKQINIHVFDTIADLKMRLMQPLTNVNFVYIGAHGSQGTEIGSRQLESERITQLHLASKETEREWRPLFFVNTCHSANLGTTTSGAKSGLLDVIMAYMACGYIGTLGAVGNKVATRVAERMLTEAMAPGGAYIAEILRDLREEIAGKIHAENFKILPQEEQAALQKDFFYVFMYVYYGNLVTRLHLQPKAASVEGGEHVARII